MTTNVDRLVNVNPTITTTKPGRINCGMIQTLPNQLSSTKIKLKLAEIRVPAQPKQQQASKINQSKRSRSRGHCPKHPPSHTRIENKQPRLVLSTNTKIRKETKRRWRSTRKREGGRAKGCCWPLFNL
jgi:hypothetical protein